MHRQHGLLHRKESLRPLGRPLELIASDARRLGSRLQNPPRGSSFAKLEGVRRAYDHVLVEGCAALSVDHLLQVLPGTSSTWSGRAWKACCGSLVCASTRRYEGRSSRVPRLCGRGRR